MSDLLNQASLVMIPSGYEEDTVYSQIPQDGSGDMAFTRASNGTRINSAGLVEVCPWNLAGYSEEFDNAAWVKTTDGQVTITANATTAPNGTTTADKMIASAIAGFHCVAQTQSLVAGVFTISIYAKASEYSFLQIFDSLTTDFANFNLTTGAVATVDQYTATIESVGNGWYRCTATKTNPSGNFVFRYGIVTTGTATRGESFTGNGVNGLFIWGAQLNIGSTAKPYFPTTDRLNVPRLTYQNGGGGCPSLLLEKQSTNLLTYSQDFSNVAWSKYGTPTLTGGILSPDGTNNAFELTMGVSQGIYQNATNTAGSYACSIWIKADTSGVIGLFDGNNGATVTRTVNVTTRWQQVSVNLTKGTSPLQYAVYRLDSSYLSKVYIYGAQCEAGSYPTSYIPTTSSSATRVADACSKTGISSLIGQTQGTMFVDSVLTHSTTNNEYLIQVSESASNRFFIYREAGTNKLGCFARVGSTTIYTQLTSGAITGRVKASFAYQSGSFAFYVNGTQIGVSTATFSTPPTMDRLDIDSNAGAENGYYNYNEAIVFPTRLTNAELASLTTI